MIFAFIILSTIIVAPISYKFLCMCLSNKLYTQTKIHFGYAWAYAFTLSLFAALILWHLNYL